MASSKVTFGAILGSVQSTAQTLVNVLDVGNTLIAKAQLAASDSLENQRIESLLNRESFKETLLREKAAEDSDSELKVLEFCKQSTQHAEIYKRNYARYSELLKTK